MLASNLRNALHRVARDRFEKILAPTKEAPRDTVVIVPRRRRQVRQRSQPRVEFSMSDSVDGVAPVTGDERIEHLPDLKERHARAC